MDEERSPGFQIGFMITMISENDSIDWKLGVRQKVEANRVRPGSKSGRRASYM